MGGKALVWDPEVSGPRDFILTIVDAIGTDVIASTSFLDDFKHHACKALIIGHFTCNEKGNRNFRKHECFMKLRRGRKCSDSEGDSMRTDQHRQHSLP